MLTFNMELKLEVVLSSSIKRKKPWPRFCWLGQEKESVFLLDDKRISEINMVSGRTKKKTPKLHPLLNSVVTMTSSHNGMWLCGLLISGELFLWNKDKDLLKTAAGAPQVAHMITAFQGKTTRLSLQVSGDGIRVVLLTITGQVFLWECVDIRELMGLRDGTVRGNWAHIQSHEDTMLPSSQDKEASQHTIFLKTEAMGDTCISAFVFTSGEKLVITFLKIQWEERPMRVGVSLRSPVGYSIQWASKTYPLSRLSPPCHPVKSRGTLVPAFSPDGQLLAIVLNQRQPRATQVLFVSTQNFVSISSSLGGCGSKNPNIPAKYIRSYWVGSVSWTPCGLFLACILKRGSLLLLARLGGLLLLTSSGCSVDFGPAHFLPLHPLVTYRPPVSAGRGEASLSSSSMSMRDVLRQRYSVTWHPRLLYLIVSDGYMATVLRVLDRPSPSLLLKTLLKDTHKDLEKASQILDKSQIHTRVWLESVSCLNPDSSLEQLNPIVTSGLNTTDAVISPATDESTLPLFLQDQGTMNSTRELLQKVQDFFEDDSDLEGPPAGSHREDGGHLEFASMFDTLHALDIPTATGPVPEPDHGRDFAESGRKTPSLHRELGKIQGRLLTAWAFGISLGNAVEHRGCLLQHTICCVVRFAALLHLIPHTKVCSGKKKISVSACFLHLLKALFSFLPWDVTNSNGPGCLGLMVDLSKRLIRLLLTPHPESSCQVSSHNLSTALLILQLTSDSLDHTYNLQQRAVWSSAQKESVSQPAELWPSDIYYVPLLQNEKEEKPFVHQGCPVPQRPSSRLFAVWQWVHKITQQYVNELKDFKGCDGWEEEQQQVSVILSQIQTALQATGERLEEGPALLSYPDCDRSVFQETRLCLALLYGLLSQYHLREAQELGDHMARLILHRAGHQRNNVTYVTDALTWLPADLHSEAAFAVVQTLGRFMASYFTNQPLYILPPHNVTVLPPLHLPHGPNVGRLMPMCQEEVAKAIRRQQLSEVWTVDYAQDLLLLGGLLPETVWLAHHLGDWKTAASLSVAYRSYCSSHYDFTRLRRRELHLPKALEPAIIFQAELECLLSNKTDSWGLGDNKSDRSFTDPLEGEDWQLLQVSIHEILKASVMAGVNVLSSPLSSLLDTAKGLCCCLPTLVPNGLYLPSPPLYCPQPSPNTQDPIGTFGQLTEVASRHKVSGVLQRLLLLLRSARCCRPAAQWYISHLRRAKHILHKTPGDSEVRSSCVDALRWACRYLPFSHFLNSEEILQDIVLSLVSELPPICLVADTLVRAFPEEEESVRVPLREKYNSLLQRLRQYTVLEGEKEEGNELIILIQDKLRQRRKHHVRLQRHLAPPELYLWEKEEEEEEKCSRHGMDMLKQLSLGTSLSNSTLTDCGYPTVCSDGDTVENTSEAFCPDLHSRPRSRSKKTKIQDREDAKRTALKIDRVIQEESDACPVPDKENEGQPNAQQLPVVGTWEFELEDEEYLNCLELFLSYVLEKDSADGGDSGAELPLLKGLCSQLRERELHSLTFDVLTTIRRRQRDGRHPARRQQEGKAAPVFRAGCCYKPTEHGTTPEPQASSVWSEGPLSRMSLSVTSLSGLRPGRQKGLFGLQQQIRVLSERRAKGSHLGTEASLMESAFPLGQPSECSLFGSLTSVETMIELQQELDPKLEAQFPELGRLLEWMVRWADRRVLLGHHSKKKAKGEGVGGTTDEGVVIRVKASAPAVLTSLSLLYHRYTVLIGTGRYSDHIRVPQMQWTVAPVLQPEVDKQLERESSIDTGYPGSTNTPTTVPDHNLQQEEPSAGSHADEPEEVMFQRTPLPDDQDQVTLGAEIRVLSLPQPALNEFHVIPEQEGKNSESNGLRVSSSASGGNMSDNTCTQERSLRLEDLDYIEGDEDSSISSLMNDGIDTPPQPEPQALLTVQPQVEIHSELCDLTGVHLHSAPVAPQNFQIPAAGAPTTVPNQPSVPQDSPFRQRLGDDLFRLVQNINYLSLMEVLGASFSSLQSAQQNTCLTQSNTNPSHPNVSSSCASGFVPQTNLLPVQTTISVGPQAQSSGSHVPQCMSADQPLMQRSVKPSAVKPFDLHPATRRTLHSAEGNYQPLSVQAQSPEIQFGEKGRLIPSSQGLLTTTDLSHPIPNVPVVQPCNGNIQNVPATQVLGPKLLQLHHPLLPQQSSAHYPPAQEAQHLLTMNQPTSKRTEEDKRYGSSVPCKQPSLAFNINPPHDPISRAAHPQTQTPQPYLERSRGQVFSLIPPALAAQRPAPTQGLRLLRFQPAPHSSTTFPNLPIQSSSRPSTIFRAPIREMTSVKLLHIESKPKMILPMVAPTAPMTSLIPLEALTNSAIRRQTAEEARLQLLRVDPPTESSRKAATSISSSSTRRQKRREEKARTGKTEVTFRPNESIIPTQELIDGPVKEESAINGKPITPGSDFAIPLGSFDSLLTGQRLLDKSMSTTAELHAYASMCKRAPECHDASTNTDPAQSTVNQHFQDAEETPLEPEKNLDLKGHHFITVFDLEDQALHQDLPSRVSPPIQDVPSTHPSSDTSAQLHVLATSVIRASAVPTHPTVAADSLTLTAVPDMTEESPACSHIGSNGDLERITPQDRTDISETHQSQNAQSPGAPSVSSTTPVWFSARMSEMDTQLAALQNIADNMEINFSNAKMFMNTTEMLKPTLATDVKSTMRLKKTVRLSVPKEAWRPRPSPSAELDTCEEEEEENQEESHVVPNDSFTPERQPLVLSSPYRQSHIIDPSRLHTTAKMKEQATNAAGPSTEWADETPDQTELKDTVDMLEELVKEGFLSQTDLDSFNSQAAHRSSRLDQQLSRRMWERHVAPDEERRDLRIWMRRKQRERLAVYQKHREKLREQEHRPYTPSVTVKPTKKNRATNCSTRLTKDKLNRTMILEQYHQRTREACSLVKELVSPPAIPSSAPAEGVLLPSSTRPVTIQSSGSSHRMQSSFADDKRNHLKSQSGQVRSHLRPWTAEEQGRLLILEDHCRRLGLHRPVTVLPRDRLSQVTRRGMLTDVKSHAKSHATSQDQQRKMMNKFPSGGSSVGSQVQREQRRIGEEIEEVDPSATWMLGLEEFDSRPVVAGLLDDQDDDVRAGTSGMDWLENLSDSSSILSKIDWAAIERMVADEEPL
ncbi:hypothetical protein LDENG_00114050 [Lucifuga dentata]|nr:hypothetical protein LDENG_00114050 [Lucifuga dentata]